MQEQFRTHWRFLILLGLFIAAVIVQHAVLPAMEGGDEYLNYNYIQFLVEQNRLPDRASYLSSTMQQQSGQPPLMYWMTSLLIRLFNVPMDGSLERYEALKNPWYAPPNPWNRTDNRNLHFQGAGDQSFATPVTERSDQIMRFAALPFGILAVIGAYGAAREVFPRESWTLVATAIFAFTPQMVHISTFVNTDVGTTAFSTLVIWQTLRLLRLGASPTRLLWIGVLLGLGALSKVNTLLITLAVGVALLIDWRKHNISLLQLLINGIILALPLVLMFGPWVIYGALAYQDPIGTSTHHRPGYFFDQPLNLIDLLPLFPEVYLGYWGKLAAAVYLHPVTYTVLGTLLVLAILGYARRLIFRLSSNSVGAWRVPQGLPACPAAFSGVVTMPKLVIQQALILLIALIASAAGLIHWLQTIHFITGRLMYDTHIAVAIGIVGGLYFLAPKSKTLQLYALGVIVAAGLLLAPMSLYTAYAPPAMLTRDQLPALQGSAIDFEHTIRFLGFTQESNVLRGDSHTIQLCWEVLQATMRPAAFSIKLVHDGQIIADRTSVHGMGRYISAIWKPGDIFCDTVEIPITTAPQAGQVYDILLVLLDARTQAVDWQATTPDGTPIQYPFIGKVTA
jgi:4-amino-4-deoxy-L-arabinose transferase-like glycosyltransferase